MKEKNKKILVALLAVIIMVGVVIYVGYRSHKKTVARRARETEIKSQKEKIIRDFAKRYNALTDWNKDIHLTIQLQELLVNSDRHILFTGPIDDIFMKEGQYYIRFVTGGLWSRDFYQREIYFVLKCGPDKVLEVMDEMTKRGAESYFLRSFGDQYAVVAKVENVKKPVLQISGYSRREQYEDEEYEIVEFQYEPSDTFIASGTCIDFVLWDREED